MGYQLFFDRNPLHKEELASDAKWQQAVRKLAKKSATSYKCPTAHGNRTVTLMLIPTENTIRTQRAEPLQNHTIKAECRTSRIVLLFEILLQIDVSIRKCLNTLILGWPQITHQ